MPSKADSAVARTIGIDTGKNTLHMVEPAIQLDEEPTIVVCEPDAATQLAPQYNHLMSERGILCLKPQLRLEWRGQDGQNETEQPDHATRLGDSATSSTRMRFSAHTGIAVALLGSVTAKVLVHTAVPVLVCH